MEMFNLDFNAIDKILNEVDNILYEIPKKTTKYKIKKIIKSFLIHLAGLSYSAILKLYTLDNEEVYINDSLLNEKLLSYSLDFKKFYVYFKKYVKPDFENSFSKARLTNIARAILKNNGLFVSKVGDRERLDIIENIYITLFNCVAYTLNIDDEFISIKKTYI